jgi:phospholipase C
MGYSHPGKAEKSLRSEKSQMTRSTIFWSGSLLAGALLLLLVLSGCGGGSGPTGPTASLSASPNAVEKSTPVTLSWQTSNATSVSISGIGTVPSSGSQQVMPTSTTTYTLTAQGPDGVQEAQSTVVVTSTPIQHVVIIFQENRTPDNLFHDPVLIKRGADIKNVGTNSSGGQETLSPIPLAATSTYPYDLSHQHVAFVSMCDRDPGTGVCKMDGADKIGLFCPNGPPPCWPAGHDPQFYSVQPQDVQPYFQLAETYTFGDHMFQTNQGPSFPAHQFIISGTSAPTAPGKKFSDYFLAENPAGGGLKMPGDDTGCTAPAGEYAKLIDPNGVENVDYNQGYPCYDHPTLTDLLNNLAIPWRYYAPNPGSIWTAPNAIKHMCVPNQSAGGTCTGSDWVNNVVLNQAQVLTDIQGGRLAAVTWVIPDGHESDHAKDNDGTGPAWVASVVNAIGNSQFWSNTAIFITWDDWGGWYDHVPPPSSGYSDGSGSAYVYGFRVPLIVVSPYAKAAHISHNVHDFGSILKYIEEDFQLTTVAPGYADSSTVTDDLSDCFDYSQTPLTFSSIKSQKKAGYFIHDKRPRTDPDDD